VAGASVAAAPGLLGKPAPDFALRSMSGGNLRLSEFRGQVVVVNFWARWAADSRDEMPALDRINTTYGRAGLVVLGVSVGEDARHAEDFAGKLRLGYPILFDANSETGREYLVDKMPMTFMIDRSGVVRYVNAGFKRGDDQVFLEQIRELLRD
jgi:peroxiredoxin